MKRLIKLFTVLLFANSAFAQIAPWKLTGPSLFPVNVSGQINGIGRVTQIKFHPSNTSKIYATSASGGLWLSTDNALSWNQMQTDGLPQMACASVCVDHTDENIIYLGSGDPNYYSTDLGIWKTTDGGQNWNQINSGIGTRMALDIVMSPSDNNILLAATNDGIWKTINGGATWTVKKSGGDFQQMVLKPGSTSTLYAVTSSQFYKSTDFGDTWTQITNGITIPGGNGNGFRLATSAANSGIVYLGMIAGEGTILKSTDSGNSFTTVYANPSQSLVGYDAGGNGQGNYNFSMCADPTDADRVFVVAHVVWRSDDGGATWTQLTDWWDNLHTDMHHILFNPYNNNQLFEANDGGVWLSTDLGDTWTPRSDGLGATECYHAAQDPAVRDIVDIGTQDNGELFYVPSGWKTSRGGDWGSKQRISYENNSMIYYFENGNRKSVTGGAEVSYNSPFTASGSVAGKTNMTFITNMPNTAFISYKDVWRTSNLSAGTPTWKKLTTVNVDVKALCVSPADSNILYVVFSNNTIKRSDDALASNPAFTSLTAPAGTGVVASITGVKTNPNVVYITCGNKVYRSTDKGATWTNISGTLPSININRIVHDEYSANEAVYVCNNSEVYYYDTTLSDWVNYSLGLPSIAGITDFMIYNEPTAAALLRVSYYGRGVWERELNRTNSLPSATFTADITAICPNDSIHFTSTTFGNPTSYNWSFQGASPATSNLANPAVYYSAPGVYDVTLTVTNANGSYTVPHYGYIEVKNTYSLPLNEGFENSSSLPSYWENYDEGNNGIVWNVTGAAGGFGNSNSSIYFDNYNNALLGHYDDFRTPMYNLSGMQNITLTFDVAYARYDAVNYDSLVVLVSTDCGETFTEVYSKGGTDLATTTDQTGFFTPASTDWRTETVDLNTYTGAPELMVVFQNRGNYGNAVYVDNINLNAIFTSVKNDKTSTVRVSPNPANNFVFIETENIINTVFELINMRGEIVMSGQLTQKRTKLETANLATGAYVIRITGNNMTETQKIVIEK